MEKMGRPPKNGRVGLWQLSRSLMILKDYLKARRGGLKYSAAVRETVDDVRQLVPGMPVSETEVKRVVALLSPENRPLAAIVDSRILEGQEAARIRRFHAEMMEYAGIKSFANMTDSDWNKPLTRFTLGFGPKPEYPRHNAKKSKSQDSPSI